MYGMVKTYADLNTFTSLFNACNSNCILFYRFYVFYVAFNKVTDKQVKEKQTLRGY